MCVLGLKSINCNYIVFVFSFCWGGGIWRNMIQECQFLTLLLLLVPRGTVAQIVKSENNKFTSQMGAVVQRQGDMRDKIKVLYNEIEVHGH